MMRKNRKILSVIFTTALLLVACNHASDGLSAKSNKETANPKVDEDLGKNQSESSPKDTEANDQEESTNNQTSSNSNNGDSATISQKDEYLQKLNEMEEEDRNAEAKTTMVEMEKQEAERFKKWDDELNKIYGILKEQLSPDKMDNLREEQRNWIKHRDEEAKESSLKYKGGSTESLEYVATQASLTRERCYELVAHYMK